MKFTRIYSTLDTKIKAVVYSSIPKFRKKDGWISYSIVVHETLGSENSKEILVIGMHLENVAKISGR